MVSAPILFLWIFIFFIAIITVFSMIRYAIQSNTKRSKMNPSINTSINPPMNMNNPIETIINSPIISPMVSPIISPINASKNPSKNLSDNPPIKPKIQLQQQILPSLVIPSIPNIPKSLKSKESKEPKEPKNPKKHTLTESDFVDTEIKYDPNIANRIDEYQLEIKELKIQLASLNEFIQKIQVLLQVDAVEYIIPKIEEILHFNDELVSEYEAENQPIIVSPGGSVVSKSGKSSIHSDLDAAYQELLHAKTGMLDEETELEINAHEQEINEKETKIKQQQDKIDAQNLELINQKSIIDEHEITIEKQKKDINDLLNDYETLQNKIDENALIVKEIGKLLKVKNPEFLIESIKTLKAKYKEENRKLASVKDKIKLKKDEYKKEIKSLEDDLLKYQDEATTCKADLILSQNDVQEEKNKYLNINKEFQALKQVYDDTQVDLINALNDELFKLPQQIYVYDHNSKKFLEASINLNPDKTFSIYSI